MLFIFSCQVYSLNEKEDSYKSSELKKKIRNIEVLNAISRHTSIAFTIFLIYFGFYLCVPGSLILGFFMSLYVMERQSKRVEVVKVLEAKEKDNYDELTDMI